MIGIGSRVICVNDTVESGWGWNVPPNFPVKGCVYTIREIIIGPRCQGDDASAPGYLLEEIVNDPCMSYAENGAVVHFEPAFYAWRFRPVKETDIEVFRQILVDVDKYDMVEW